MNRDQSDDTRETLSACPVCGAADLESLGEVGDRLFRTTDKTFSMARCRSCRVSFLSPPPPPDELAAYYPQGYWLGPADGSGRGLRGKLTEVYRRLVLRDHLKFVGRIVRQQRSRGLEVRILDLGCGDGSFLSALGEKSCVGLDTSADALAAARARGLTVVHGEPTKCSLADKSFSLITMFHMLEHVPTPEPVLAAARRLLRKDGDLVVQVPNTRSWQARLFGLRWANLDVPRHLVNYSDRSLVATLQRSGFGVQRKSYFSLRDNPTAFASSICPGLYPPGRMSHGHGGGWLSDLAYLGLTVAALPFCLLESACGRGGAIMVQARPC